MEAGNNCGQHCTDTDKSECSGSLRVNGCFCKDGWFMSAGTCVEICPCTATVPGSTTLKFYDQGDVKLNEKEQWCVTIKNQYRFRRSL